jgi:glycosyltransferase involved in cell wall biosynthesis
MKLLHLISSLDPAGGGPIEGLLRQNEACGGSDGPIKREIASLDLPGSPHVSRTPLPVHALGRGQRGGWPWDRALRHYGWSPDYVPWLRANVASFDAVIVHGLWNYAAFGASRVLPGGPTPYFVFPHGMMDPWFRRTSPLKHLAKQAFWLVGEGRLLAGARAVFFTSEEERRQARGEFPAHRYHETVVDYGAAAPPSRMINHDAAFRAAVPELGRRPYLLFLGRIHRKKGCDLLIEAFARTVADNPGVDLVMAGPDQTNWRPELEARASRLNVANKIHWPGPFYGDAKWGALHGADAFVLPSHQENFGIAVAEALGCGTPVLISDKVNIWREIDEAGAGLVEPDTVDGIEALLRRWFALAEPRRTAMHQTAQTLFIKRFNVARAAPALIETIRSLS